MLIHEAAIMPINRNRLHKQPKIYNKLINIDIFKVY